MPYEYVTTGVPTGSDIGFIFIGLGVMVLVIVLAWFFYQIGRIFKENADTEQYENTYYIAALKQSAKKRGLDLDKEVASRNLFRSLQKERSFRREMRIETIEAMFGKKEKKKED